MFKIHFITANGKWALRVTELVAVGFKQVEEVSEHLIFLGYAKRIIYILQFVLKTPIQPDLQK